MKIKLDLEYETEMLTANECPYTALWMGVIEHAFTEWCRLANCPVGQYRVGTHREIFRFFFLAQEESNSLTELCDLVDRPYLASAIQKHAILKGVGIRDLTRIQIITTKDKTCSFCSQTKPFYDFYSFFYDRIRPQEICFDCCQLAPRYGCDAKLYHGTDRVTLYAENYVKGMTPVTDVIKINIAQYAA